MCRVGRHLVAIRAGVARAEVHQSRVPPVLLTSGTSVFLADGPKDGHCSGFMMSLLLNLRGGIILLVILARQNNAGLARLQLPPLCIIPDDTCL